MTDLLYGFQIALLPQNLLLCFIGVLLGTLVGVLPGIGPIGAMAILLPASLKITPVGSIIMLAGIYYGAMYGGSITSILVNIPGEAASVVTTLDGYQMARAGRAGPALGISAFGSFIAGTLSVFGIVLFARPLSSLALSFGPPEYFGLMCLGMSLVIYLAQKSIEKAVISGLIGLMLSWVGMDMVTGQQRFTFGVNELSDGISMTAMFMGLFGISEILVNLEQEVDAEIIESDLRQVLPSLKDWQESFGPILRGGVLGFFLGLLPGGGAIISSFASYVLEKRLAKNPETFGYGNIRGVAGPESANNAASESSLIPLLSLGIPPNAVIALLFSALLIHGVRPGPFLIKEHPDIFWGIIASLYIGNVFLLILNVPLIGLWVKVLKIPYRIIFPLIILFCLVGAFSISTSILDLKFMLAFGILGYLMQKFEFELAPLALAFVLGPLVELNFRQSLIISQGSLMVFVNHPISFICLLITFFLFLSNLFPLVRRKLKSLEG
jgi:putative tricarboxylic transport membrane protein